MPLNPKAPPPTRREQATRKLSRDWTIIALTVAVVCLGAAFGATPASVMLAAFAGIAGYFLARQR